ncbi:deoxyribodipyrimidine photo-lyase [Pelagimonas varians]|uniref:Deoxyribodipyrimidine photo-lyase n=2 Tax=Pelagimonas varians TaxID=696760 RepID=A0A238JUB0_9RHOB|nr:deoxyribodipyrimidine photo-lyase [Pelagimonas varians]SMX34220.1 Deoxyribodipyrimidine photo-lyase [Pelagimonas varians]
MSIDMTQPPIIVWMRRDLRLHDHTALFEASRSGRPVIPVFICDETVQALGAAPKWRLEQGLSCFAHSLEEAGSRLTLRLGNAAIVLDRLIEETGATDVYWQRAYDPERVAQDTRIKADLTTRGIHARSFSGAVLHEPMQIKTGQGGDYKVYSAFRRAVWQRPIVPAMLAKPDLTAPETWPDSDRLADWGLGRGMKRGGAIVAQHTLVGEKAALDRLSEFLESRLAGYAGDRDVPAQPATSRLSAHLTLGEISVARCWTLAWQALETGNPGAETFLKELLWREFAGYLLWHSPHMGTEVWRPDWQGFHWNEDRHDPKFIAWTQGRTGVELVDAGMREMYVTGVMHNRVRMIVASYLTKHLRMHWRLGQDWFAECLTDWDVASNAMGWQWVAGCGPDASPYFRVFNPQTQQVKFDGKGAYINHWLAEHRGTSAHKDALSYFEAIPESWNLSPEAAYPAPIVSLAEGRTAALAAYDDWKSQKP